MAARDDQDELLRSVAPQNAQSTFLARQRAEEELVRAKEALELRTAELAKSLAMMRATLESTTDGILVTDGDDNITSFNQRFADMWRVPDDIMDSREHQRLLDHNSRQFADPVQFLARVEEICASAPPSSYDLLERGDARVFERFSRIQVVDGRTVGRVWSFRDVTDERRSVAALNRAAQTTRFLADASAALSELTDYETTVQRIAELAVPVFADWCAVDIRNADGTVRSLAITHPDPAKVELIRQLQTRYPKAPNDLRGTTPAVRAGEPELVAEIPDSMLRDYIRDEDAFRMIRESGLKSYISVPLTSRNQAALGTLTFVTAESGRIFDADDLRAAVDLAHRAAIAIGNASLLGALKESDRRKDEFLAVLAHELRNPLAPVRNALEVMRAKAPRVPELKWAGDIIDRQVDQMTRLIDDLLDVSRISRGKIDLRRERIELAAVVQDAAEACRPLVEKRGHVLTVTIPPEPIVLDADPTRLAQVLLNLLNNAAKYTDRGGRIWLTAERVGGQVEVRVKDTGVGISPNMLPRVFDMFTQVDGAMERSQGGLGIGLTLAKRLVELHGGTVEAHSAGLGTGSEFIVRLPVAGQAT